MGGHHGDLVDDQRHAYWRHLNTSFVAKKYNKNNTYKALLSQLEYLGKSCLLIALFSPFVTFVVSIHRNRLFIPKTLTGEC